MKVSNKQDLVTLLQQHQDHFKKLGVRRFGLFGSFVKDQVNEDSDVDILVMFEPALKTFNNFMELSIFLEDLLGRKVDLITIESLSPYLGKKILKEAEYVSLSH
ncbi:nucleotidyltransferase family protein [Crocosphaera sp. XPORK-15E]|uniref:nucleotidyltransferase family protein n=1 Tax=Crocosphaera sp. XPORK-15E TaxID=3110247 RepID=UPI002B219B71|nr:nucleotidyltransferase family protein [Crocosphaera sp. XPORK-15E]MEA5533888.1 nucleotidyltransferase family protein [Crocosphaera sp. XPORK-15E]